MYCSKCGKQASDGDKFCQNCGTKIKGSEITKNDEIKNEPINSLKKNNTKKNLIIGTTICLFLALCLSIIYFKFMIKPKNTSVPQSTDAELQNNTGDTKETLDKIKEANKEKEVFAKLLKSPKWLTENTDYKKSPDNVKFTILDINQDGVCEMLLYYGESGGLAGLTLSVVSYNTDEDKINAQKINVSHGSYRGYLSNEKTIVVGGGSQGSSYMSGYKPEGDRYLETFFTLDTAGAYLDENKAVYTLNDNNVSKEKYNQFIDPIKANLTHTEMYPISNENIKNVLEVDPDTIVVDNSIDKYSTLKFSTAEQAKEWLLKQDSTFIAKYNANLIKEDIDNELIKTFFQCYVLEQDDYYLFLLPFDESGNEESMHYLVGKHTGNVYSISPSAGGYAYLIKDSRVIEKLKYNNEKSGDWRELKKQ